MALLIIRVMTWIIDHDLPDGRYHIALPQANDTNTTKPLVKRYPHDMASGLERRGSEGSLNLVKRYYNKHNGVYPKRLTDDKWVIEKETGKVPIPITENGCEDHSRDLDEDDYLASKQSFFNWCALYHGYGDHIELSLKGTVAVFACTNGPQMSCSGKEYEYAEKVFDKACGEKKPGWIYARDWAKGYGRAFKGTDVCGVWDMVLTHP
ncbi:Fc.00g008140.m01.CDS01 [Cosmosporella sp. VM-42]